MKKVKYNDIYIYIDDRKLEKEMTGAIIKEKMEKIMQKVEKINENNISEEKEEKNEQ